MEQLGRPWLPQAVPAPFDARFGGIFFTVLAGGLLAIFWLTAHGRWP